MKMDRIGRLQTDYFDDGWPDATWITAFHRNGSNELVGKLEINGNEIDDLVYILTKIQKQRKEQKQNKTIDR